MFQIIIIAIIFYVVYKNRVAGKGNRRGQSVRTISTNDLKNTNPTRQNSVQTPQTPVYNGGTTPAIPDPEVRPDGQETTTEYLNRKARQDEIEHKKEALQQRREERKNYGHINYAGRWYEGDLIPDSKKIVICGYCGAENLVSKGATHKYNCYFCREAL